MSKTVRILLLVLAVLLTLPEAEAQRRKRRTRQQKPRTEQRSMENVRREQNTTQRRISETATRLDNNDKELNRQMSRLNELNADIATQQEKVQGLRSRVDSLGGAIRTTSDSISILEGELVQLREAYADALAKIQPSASQLNSVTFIFSAKSFSEAWSRLRYLRRFAKWRSDKAEAVNRAIDRIATERSKLTMLRHSQDVARRQAETEGRTLQNQQAESRRMVESLRKEDSRLRAQLKEYRRRSAALDNELERLIAAEQRRIEREERERREAEKRARQGKGRGGAKSQGGKSGGTNAKSSGRGNGSGTGQAPMLAAADTRPERLTGSFAGNKGRLLFPVAGKYRIVRRFGSQPHPTLPHVTVDNSGIDIQTAAGSKARAVFEGTVSAIFRQDGFNNIVMLRHGKYLTIYAGLSGVNVSKGQKVKAGDTLGTLATEILHFEVRNERQKLNPTAWVK